MQAEAKIKLTKAQKRTLGEIKSYPGGHLRKHRRGGKLLCYRLMDKDLNPVKNISYSMVNKLIDRFKIKKEGDVFVVNEADKTN